VPVREQGALLAGRYRVVRRLGSGGMATVLLCQDERLDRLVAVKRLHASAPEDFEARFVREAKLGASLNHPNLVAVFDTEIDDEGVLIVMEHVEGESLAAALRSGPLAPRHVALVARDLGGALDHAHTHGVVHRDVKPANVLLREDGVTKLADLGIAVAVDQTRITRSGTVLGSAGYMAPEQLEGRELGPPADVYALATVCFEALCGRRAREGRTPMEIAHQIATEDPPDVRAHAPELPAAAAEALVRGMAREPSERPASAGELAEELGEALEGRRTTAVEPPTAPTRVVAAASPPTAGRPASAGAAGRPATARSASGRPTRRGRFAGALAVALLALAVAAVAAAVLLSSGGEDGGQRTQQSEQAQGERSTPDRQAGGEQPSGGQAEEQPAEPDPSESAPTEEEPVEPAPSDGGIDIDPARGAELNEQGFALMGEGDYAGAVPILEKSVASWPDDSRDLNYAYALYNLGVSLNRSGRAAEAIPYLEKRLTWNNQRGVVKQELDLARENAQG
jgi:tetratricopeptide (TPR) repeat protein